MKRLVLSCFILLLLLASSLFSGRHINNLCSGYIHDLTAAHQLAAKNDWDQARIITQKVYQDWDDRDFLLHTLLRHSDTDQILLSFRSVHEYLLLEEMDEYSAANAQLITQMELLAETEQPTLKNVL